MGTTNFAISYWNQFDGGRTEIIQDQEGKRVTPSVINFKKQDGALIVGTNAKVLAKRSPQSTFYDAKRMIGKNFDDPEVQSDLRYWSFSVGQNEKKMPVYLFTDKYNNPKTMLPE